MYNLKLFQSALVWRLYFIMNTHFISLVEVVNFLCNDVRKYPCKCIEYCGEPLILNEEPLYPSNPKTEYIIHDNIFSTGRFGKDFGSIQVRKKGENPDKVITLYLYDWDMLDLIEILKKYSEAGSI